MRPSGRTQRDLPGSGLGILESFAGATPGRLVPNRDPALDGPVSSQLRQVLRTGRGLGAGSDYGLGLVGTGECGDVVFGIEVNVVIAQSPVRGIRDRTSITPVPNESKLNLARIVKGDGRAMMLGGDAT